ncbi:MAG: PQQ-binding-like beta-propeller repeat protein [Caldimonas sp.]
MKEAPSTSLGSDRMRPKIRRSWTLATAVVLVGALLAGAVAIAAVFPLRWRALVVFDKATGQLQDIGWGDLLAMLRPGNGVDLKGLADEPNPHAVIANPRRTEADVAAGKDHFGRHCRSCHGDEARGGAGGPSLHERVFKQGRSPWALYRTIAYGIPGTAMVGRTLPRDDTWQLVAYLQSTLSGPPGEDDDRGPRLAMAPVTAEELRNASARPEEWLTYAGTHDGQRHSRLKQISRDTVSHLHMVWQRQFPQSEGRAKASPIVRGSTMFVTEPPNHVVALDATSGQVLWTFSYALPQRLKLCCGPASRGVAVLGNRVFIGTADAHLIALDADTGKVIWNVEVAESSAGYSITGAPLAVGDMIVTGVGGGEFPTRGFVDAYDASSGQRRWRFYTVPSVGEPGSETWERANLATGGAPTWMTGAFDAEQNVIFWGIGNPNPNYDGTNRGGDNLYSNCVVALDAATGKLRWYFQFTPHDLHDWDAAQTPVLVDEPNTGRRLMAWPNRNGFYYLLDRRTGEYLLGKAFIRQSWSDGLDARGRPQVRPESVPTRTGVLVYPSSTGATNWWAMAFDPALGLVFAPTMDRAEIFFGSPERDEGEHGEVSGSRTATPSGARLTTAVKAIDVATGQIRWEYSRSPRTHHATMGGLLSTAGGLVFGSDVETFFALDAATGAPVWQFHAGAEMPGGPVSYQIAGRQYVAIAAGNSILAFALSP